MADDVHDDIVTEEAAVESAAIADGKDLGAEGNHGACGLFDGGIDGDPAHFGIHDIGDFHKAPSGLRP